MGNSRENEVSRTFILEAKVQGSAEQIGAGGEWRTQSVFTKLGHEG